MRTVPPYVTEELVRQPEGELRKLATRRGPLRPRRLRCRLAGQHQNRGRIQPARTCSEGIWPRAGVAGSGAV
jgi:hypothetical protein